MPDEVFFAGLNVSENMIFEDIETFGGHHFRSDFFSVILVTEGQINATINLQPYSNKANDLIVVPPNGIKQLVSCSPDAKVMAVSFTVSFLIEAGMPAHTHSVLDFFITKSNPVWQLEEEDLRTIRDMMQDLYKRCKLANVRMWGKEQLFHTFFLFLYELGILSHKYSSIGIVQYTRKEDLIIRFTELVTLHCMRERSVQYYADQLHVTAKYLTETVKEISGQNAGEVIDDIVIMEAKLLLDNPLYSIGQVASLMNFSDQSFFGKYFKRHTGISPKKYRTAIY
ncbi:AraC-type DNA-binding protein [Flexibacter flexilis DSM 6793]|uniref:AraC-type DNA-binding protein n=2 Tax=Flexibacter flexilis TaxID=998 RepID=A0A1I1F380_9BACT|nr:AraC-type DNA-binding protein [Flexibacter flexilis DSM 6793]